MHDVWSKIKPYIIGFFVAIGSVIAYLLGRRTGVGGKHDGDGSQTSAGRIRDAIGDNDERAGEIAEHQSSLEGVEREKLRIDRQRDELESRTTDSEESGRRTVQDNRDFLRRLREGKPPSDD